MPESGAEINEPSTPKIERPNITNPKAFNAWLDKYIDTPFAGASGKTHLDGTPTSRKEQIEMTKEQFRMFPELIQIGKYSVDEATDLITQQVMTLRDTKNKRLPEKARLFVTRHMPTLKRR